MCSRRSSCAPTTTSTIAPLAIDDATAAPPSRSRSPTPSRPSPAFVQQRSTFNQIIGVTVIDRGRRGRPVLRLDHRRALGLYGVLKALGARCSTLFAGVVAQAVVVTAVAAVIAGGLGAARRRDPARVDPARRHPARIVTSAVLMLVAADRRLRLLPAPRPADRPGRHRRSDDHGHRDHDTSIPPPPRCGWRAQGLHRWRRGGRRPRPRRPRPSAPTRSSPSSARPGRARRRCARSPAASSPHRRRRVVGGEDISGLSAKQLTEFRRRQWGSCSSR